MTNEELIIWCEEKIQELNYFLQDIKDHNCYGYGECEGKIYAYEKIIGLLDSRKID